VDVRLSAEQRALRDSAAHLLDRLGPGTVRGLDDAERAAKLDAAVAATGWRDLRTADADGRPWATAVEVALVAEEMGRALADTALLGPTLAADLRRRAGAPPATTTETVLLTPDLGALATVDPTTPDPPRAPVALDARGATEALAGIATATGARLAVVPVGDVATTTDPTRPVGRPVGPATSLDGAPLGDDDLAAWTALGLAVTCADLVGTTAGAVALAVAHAGARNQYGRPIGSFQAVQHLLADAHVAVEGARSVALHAAWAVDALPPADALAAAATAKAYCGRAARTACETAIQVHGGIGNTWECAAHVHLRRALLATDVLGGVDASLDRVLAHHGIGREGSDGLR
jgi:alkylation response protein AidB-like acyl-CoA dehydrogenase